MCTKTYRLSVEADTTGGCHSNHFLDFTGESFLAQKMALKTRIFLDHGEIFEDQKPKFPGCNITSGYFFSCRWSSKISPTRTTSSVNLFWPEFRGSNKN